MKRMLTVLVLGMMALSSAFGCEGKTRGGKYNITFKDYPCCFVGINLAGAIDFEVCDKLSPEVLEESKDVVRNMVKVRNEKKNTLSKAKRSKLDKEYEVLDAKLTELTGHSYDEYQEMHDRSINESGIKKLAE